MKNRISKYICILCSATLLLNTQAFALMTDEGGGGGGGMGYSLDGAGVTIPSEPVVEAPVVETPMVEAPVVETPVVETPVVETPMVEAPVVEAPVVETAIPSSPAVEAPTVQAPTTPSTPSRGITAEQIYKAFEQAEKYANWENKIFSKVTSEPNPIPVNSFGENANYIYDSQMKCVIDTRNNAYLKVYEYGTSRPYYINKGSEGEELLKQGIKPSNFIGKMMHESNGFAYHLDSSGEKAIGYTDAMYNSANNLKPVLAEELSRPSVFKRILQSLGLGGTAALAAVTVADTKAEAKDLREKAKTTSAGKNAKSGKVSANRKDIKKTTTNKNIKSTISKKSTSKKNMPKVAGGKYTTKKINGKEYDVIIKNGKIVYSRNKKTGKVNINKLGKSISESGYSFGDYKSTIKKAAKKLKATIVNKVISAVKKSKGLSTKNTKKKSKKKLVSNAKLAMNEKRTTGEKTKKTSAKKKNTKTSNSGSSKTSGINSAAKPINTVRTSSPTTKKPSVGAKALMNLPMIRAMEAMKKSVSVPKVRTTTTSSTSSGRTISTGTLGFGHSSSYSKTTSSVTGGTIPRPTVVKPSVKTGRLMTA